MDHYASVAIYTLSDPRTGVVRYVGQSIRPDRRIFQHAREDEKGNLGVQGWFLLLAAEGMAPRMEIIEWCTRPAAAERERHWILQFHAKAKLFNIACLQQRAPRCRDWNGSVREVGWLKKKIAGMKKAKPLSPDAPKVAPVRVLTRGEIDAIYGPRPKRP